MTDRNDPRDEGQPDDTVVSLNADDLDRARHAVQQALFDPIKLNGLTVDPEHTAAVIAKAELDAARPLHFGQSAIVVAFGEVADVRVRRKVESDGFEYHEAVSTLATERGFVLTEEVADLLGFTLADLRDALGAQHMRDEAQRDGHEALPLRSYYERKQDKRRSFTDRVDRG